ncbi:MULTISPECIES: hypothetical protein [Peribacillus]|uniref:hypothetical protein n=1 Tax=Peribacillus TaxID=2675229 RepID=UPI001F4E0F71|nr:MULTISPECIES: hypothetical protein [unclassified Peribacillus]MCK1983769.1 hypothetical protein [Peribacillus sp. Aquil_B1]MCK2009811.1 hypothetical protein [Peribacillus sp. Aquil_B8]
MTALIGKKFENGVFIMADKRITYRGTETFSDDEKKVIALNQNVIFAFAGVKNIIDTCMEELKMFSLGTNSIEEIEAQSQKLFRNSLEAFQKLYPEQDYATVYLLAGFTADGIPRVTYFSSDDAFQKSNPLDFFYKTFPNTEMMYLRNYLINEVDATRTDLNYFIIKFSSAIRQINNEKVSKTAYSIFLTKNGLFEIDIDEDGMIKNVQMNLDC